MAKNLDINNILRNSGYGGQEDFAQIAKWAAQQKFNSPEALLAGVAEHFKGAQPKQVIKMNDLPAQFNVFLPGGVKVNQKGEITTPFVDMMHLYETESDYYFMKGQMEGALQQLIKALRLPVAVSGATMPDLHPGYSLPIGGVVALDEAISPAFVGYDIACRMCLTLFKPGSIDPAVLDSESERKHFLDAILASSSFGLGATRAKQVDHPVMHNSLWKTIKPLNQLKALAQEQLGTQGAGNHFCDLVEVEIIAPHPALPPVGTKLVGLMTHSGSRGVGNKLGHYYAALAEKQATERGYRFEKGYGWLDMNSEAGIEYWKVMNLMGDYAQANHEIVHEAFARNVGLTSDVLVMFENHHNFAWLEDGKVVHRKGATPARTGQIGIIPGSSGTASYLVQGLGNPASLFSASHGAGRPFSRKAAKDQYDEAAFVGHMEGNRITFYGVAKDETFMAYKDINQVMEAQQDLVQPIARMRPRVVVMGGLVQSDDGD